MRHIVALSGGKDSTAMALRLAEVEPQNYEYWITPTGNELPEMFAHWKRLEALLGKRLTVLSRKGLVSEIKRQGALPNHRMRWCTRILKIEPYQQALLSAMPCVSYVGIRADESDRDGADHTALGDVTSRYPLVEWKWGLGDVQRYLAYRGVTIPARTDCAFCFFQRLGEWRELWLKQPELYAEAEALELEIGHTFRSPSRDSWPAGLKELRAEFEAGRMPRAFTPGVSTRQTMCSFCAR